MAGTVLQFPKRKKKMKTKQIDEQVAALMMKHSRFIESRRRKGWTTDQIVKEVLARENAKR